MSKRNLDSLILSLLSEHHLLSATEILDTLGENDHHYNKTSVYRSLQRLSEAGKICEHGFESTSKYELRGDHHAHLICQHCGKIQIAECEYTHPTEITGFQVEHHHVELYGSCKKCAK